MMLKKQGGLLFFRIGMLGGSFYWAAPKNQALRDAHKQLRKLKRINLRFAARAYYRHIAETYGY